MSSVKHIAVWVLFGAAVLGAIWAWRGPKEVPYAGIERDADFWRRRADVPDDATKAQAFRQLAHVRDVRGAGLMTGALKKDPSGYVRAVAAEALGRFRDPQHVEPLAQALHDKDARVSDAAVLALAETGGDAALNALAGAIDPRDPHKTVMVTTALPSFKTGRSEDLLIGLLGSRSVWVRWRAIHALGKVGTVRCVPHLKELAADPLKGTNFVAPDTSETDIERILPRLLADAIEAASKRPPWPTPHGSPVQGAKP